MGSLYDAVCDPTNLARAIDRFVRAGGFWCKGMPMPAFQRRPVEPTLRLADELRQGRYRPEPPARFTLVQGDGRLRELCCYPVRDRVVQRAVLQVIQPLCERHFLDASFGFRPGRGVAAAHARASAWLSMGFVCVVKTDVQRAFDGIRHGPLVRRLVDWVGDARLVDLVRLCVGIARRHRAQDCGIPQGASLSPLLCNVALHGLDLCMRSARQPLVRYADDMLLLARSQNALDDALSRSVGWLRTQGLQLNANKTRRLVWPRCPVEFLGALLPVPPLAITEKRAC